MSETRYTKSGKRMAANTVGSKYGATFDTQPATIAEPRYQVSKVEAADDRTWAIFDMTGDADVPAGICDRHVFKWAAEQHANALENLHRSYHAEAARRAAGEGKRWQATVTTRDGVQRLHTMSGGTLEEVNAAVTTLTSRTSTFRIDPLCEFDGCLDVAAACSAFCAEHQAEHEANMAAAIEEVTDEANTRADDAYAAGERADQGLVICLERINREATCALEIDRSDVDAIERLGACLDAIERLRRAADQYVQEIAELR